MGILSSETVPSNFDSHQNEVIWMLFEWSENHSGASELGYIKQKRKEIFLDLKQSISKITLIKLGDLILLKHQNIEKILLKIEVI